MRTAVVILNYNTRDFLQKFLPPLLHSMPEGAEVVVADSCSTDGSMELMDELFPTVKQVRLSNNYGFTGGYNRAFKAVCELPDAKDLEYFVLINSDIEVEDGWLEPLISWMDSHPHCAACAPKLHSWFEKDKFEYAGAAGGFIDCYGYPFCRGRVMKRLETDCGQYDSPADVFWATGACLLVRKETYSRMGGLDDRFFAHMEEIDMCWRFALEGMKVTVVPQSVVWHVGGGTLPNDSPWKLKLNFRNNLMMLQNNLAKTYSLQEIRELTPDKAARKACSRAKMTICFRMALDLCSAMVYRLTGHKDKYKAVLEAHKEFKAMGKEVSVDEVETYASSHRTIDGPKMYGSWIVPLAFMKGNSIFEHLRKTL